MSYSTVGGEPLRAIQAHALIEKLHDLRHNRNSPIAWSEKRVSLWERRLPRRQAHSCALPLFWPYLLKVAGDRGNRREDRRRTAFRSERDKSRPAPPPVV